jgi:hypothetical protein
MKPGHEKGAKTFRMCGLLGFTPIETLVKLDSVSGFSGVSITLKPITISKD